jgi:hypothetical protein
VPTTAQLQTTSLASGYILGDLTANPRFKLLNCGGHSALSPRPGEGRGARFRLLFAANLSRPTGSFGQRQTKGETGQITCYKNRTS